MLALILPVMFSVKIFSQSDDDTRESIDLTKEAITLIKKDRLNEALKKLKEAVKLEEENIAAKYFIAKIHYIKGEYQKSLDIMEKLIAGKDKEDVLDQLLGNCYYKLGQVEKAIEIYNKGMLDYPYSGPLYLELGNVEKDNGNLQKAFRNYEYGIRFDPEFSDNYYNAAKLLLDEDNHWGYIYGEIYLNMEPFTKEWDEISKLMYDSYSSRVHGQNIGILKTERILTDTATSGFDRAYIETEKEANILAQLDAFSLDRLNEIRKRFIEIWLDKGYDTKYRNALYDFHKRMLDEGYFELYNYSSFSHGASEEYNKYYDKHKTNINSYNKWIDKNYLTMTNKNSVYRTMYK
jgi:tetratricopeptide (TPR) repeat protein